MPQKMPVVRSVYWPALLPQVFAIAGISLALYCLWPHARLPGCIFFAAFVYLLLCRIMRRIYAHDHAVGMLHYKARNFEAAAKRFEASFQAFSVHKRIDRLRWLLLGTAGQNSYRTMALLNLAFCHTQLGNGSKAVELYEQVLRETPDCAIAMVSLNMLNSMAAAGEHGKNA